jgi:hypothetical protein
LDFKNEEIILLVANHPTMIISSCFLSFCPVIRFVATVSKQHSKKVIQILQKFNKTAKVIGWVERPARHASRSDAGGGVWLKTKIGSIKKIEVPRGKLIPRIC